MRRANEIDFWRGLALASIFVNHIPGFYFERFTYRNFGLSDSAELFVFLAGWSLRRVADPGGGRAGTTFLILHLGARSITLYIAQLLITILALGLIAASAFLLDNPLFLDLNNASAVFQSPIEAHIGLVLMSYQLGFFDILPLYVVLIATAPLLVILHRVSARAALATSLLLYIATLATGLNVPTWPVEGTWYFNPLAWQLVFVLGYAIAGAEGLRARLGPSLAVRLLGLAIVAAGAALALNDVEPDLVSQPALRLFAIFDKTFVTPARIVHFLALVAAFHGGFALVARWAPLVARYLSLLGRRSLLVFCLGSLLSLAAQIVRYAAHDRLTDCAILAAGLTALGLAAWISEWRDRLRHSSSS